MKLYFLELRSPTYNVLPLFGFPTYTNTIGQEHSVFMKDTYMRDMRGVSTWESNGIKAMKELPNPHDMSVYHPRISDQEEERKLDQEYTQRVKSFLLQKLVKTYNGSNNPYNHIVSFRQVVRVWTSFRQSHTNRGDLDLHSRINTFHGFRHWSWVLKLLSKSWKRTLLHPFLRWT